MKRSLLTLGSVFLLLMLALAAAPAGAGASAPQAEAGKFKQTVPVNIVIVGYPSRMIDRGALLGELPATYTPVVRNSQFYGLPGRNVGLKFAFKYRLLSAGPSLSSRFFQYLTSIGTPGDPTWPQLAYNDETKNVLDVTGPVLSIDGPSVERWLSRAAQRELGIDPHSYTLFFIDWYGQPGFKFHVYTKTDEPDPDTGVNFGTLGSRAMIAWGGSSSRTWFYDLSAGPEAWTNNWDVDDADVDGDGVADYRMPPVWEYTAGGYRDPSQLSDDLGRVARYVGIDCLFTTSPLYDPLVTAPGVGGTKVQNVQMFEDGSDSNGAQWIDTPFVFDALRSFEPYYRWKVRLADEDPIDADAQRSFRIWADLLPEDSYWTPYGTTFAELFGYFDANQGRYVPPNAPNDYVGKVFAFNTTDANMGDEVGLLGFADDDWATGKQSYVFAWDTTEDRAVGYGFTATVVHEFGHHIGMSHPHDGYDAQTATDFGPGGQTYFAWSGDESNTVMQYIEVSNTFGVFDRDNMYRYEFAGYANWTSALLKSIRTDPGRIKVAGLTGQATLLAQAAATDFQDWRYLQAASSARRAYELALTAAGYLGIDTTAATRRSIMAAPASVPHQGDPVRFPGI